MNHDLKYLLINHYKKYPDMQIQDFLKLIYQFTFGPKHFHNEPDLAHIKAYLERELEGLKNLKQTQYVESIGNGYYRIYLHAIKNHKISTKELSEMFYQSILLSQPENDFIKQSFIRHIDLLIEMIKNQEISFDLETSLQIIKNYLKEGIHPIHHSDIYRKQYEPHYRVVHINTINIHLLTFVKNY